LETTLTIFVNGEHQGVPGPASVATLIEMRGPRPPFAVEVNKRLVRRGDYAATELREGDVVEIVTLVGGG
jgi:thiamine biosynthesis protein ThiS